LEEVILEKLDKNKQVLMQAEEERRKLVETLGITQGYIADLENDLAARKRIDDFKLPEKSALHKLLSK
jgi:hypothetical protein